MKLFINFRHSLYSTEYSTELKASVSRAAHFVLDYEITQDEEAAEIMITDDLGVALRLLKENEEAIVAIAEYDYQEQRQIGIKEGAEALARNFPGRVELFSMQFDALIGYLRKKKEEGVL